MDGGGPGNTLGDHLHFDSELAAGESFDIAHVFPAEGGLQVVQMGMDVDAAADDHQLVLPARWVFLPVGDRGFGFQRSLVVDLGLEPGFDHGCRMQECRVGITFNLRTLTTQVGQLCVELDRRCGQRCFRIAQRRQGFELNLHLRQGLLRILPGVGRHRQNGVADISHLVPAEHGTICNGSPLQNVIALDVRRRDHTGHPGHFFGHRCVDGDDARMREAAAQNRELERSPDRIVRGEIGGAAGLGHRRRSRMGDPHHALRRCGPDRLGRGLAAQKTPGQLDGLDDLYVTGAPAQVAAKSLFDVIDRGIRVCVQQRLSGHDHPGRAEPALDRTGQNKSFLDEVRVVRRAQPLHRDDIGIFQVGHPRQAGTHGLAVHHHGAGAALALAVAGLLGSGQPQVFPQHVQQNGFRIDDQLAICPVHTQSNLFHPVLAWPFN